MQSLDFDFGLLCLKFTKFLKSWSCVVFREEIVIWVQKKTGVPTIKLDTVDKASGFLKKHHTYIVGLFEKSKVFI